MLIIRLQRAGKRNRAEFRIVLAEKEKSAAKKFTEILGHYNPRTKDFTIKQERVQYWITQHVTLSPTIHNLFITQKLIEGNKVKAFSVPAKKEEPAAESAVTTAPAEPAAATAEVPETETAPAPTEPVATATPEQSVATEPAAENTPPA